VKHSTSYRLVTALCASLILTMGVEKLPAAESPVSFLQDVKPLLARRCFSCHGPTASEGGLRLDDSDAALAALESGLHAIVPGKVDDSQLIARISATDEAVRMPPEGKPLSAAEVETLKKWIAAGANWEKHWAFVPPQRHAPPEVTDAAWSQNPIDAFVLSKLEQTNLSPAGPADKRTLARRAYFSVTGLPPTNEQVEAFINNEDTNAWEQLVDTLLASPHYGEHWARHWLDLVRFAESNSFERDGVKPNAWKYRDYVIRSLNADKPYDQFLREQLAGDELDTVTNETIIATGYYRLGIWDDEPADPLQARYDEFDDIIATTSQAMLGLTVGCARCHDHKIDPISQTDYYGLVAFIADVTPYGDLTTREGTRNSQWDMSAPEDRAHRAKLREKSETIRQQMTSMEDVGINRMPAGLQEIGATPDRQRLIDDELEKFLNVSEWQLYQETSKRLKSTEEEIKNLPPPEAALALATCESRPAPTHVLLRGNPHVPGDAVEPQFPALFGEKAPKLPAAVEGARSAGRRRVLAEWIASSRNMLTARVIVNRVWQHHFGRGLVRSANNFGALGNPPTHPELLDFLALWLVDHNWQLKSLHRLILTSNAYRMSSAANEKALALDPANDLLWRFDMRRLSAEEVRDAVLVTSGKLNPTMFGPGIYPALSADVLASQSRPGEGWGTSTPEEQARRSVYIHVKRSLLTPLLTAFDFPDADASCEARFVTTQPGQALAMLHGDFINEQAAKLAERVANEAGAEPRAQVAHALRLALQRPASEEELADGLELLGRLTNEHGQIPADALRYWCLTVLNLNEFSYLD
jgi:hypothetical protein